MIDNHCKSVLKPAKLVYATKTKESVSCQKLGSWNFWQTVNGVLNKGKSALPPLLNSPEVFTSASDLLYVVSKIFEKLVNNKVVDHLEKCGLFSDFKYSFRSSRRTSCF